MGYIHILRLPAVNRNDFFYPHGACFPPFLPRCFAFCCVCVDRVYTLVCVYVLLVLAFPVPGCVCLVTGLIVCGVGSVIVSRRSCGLAVRFPHLLYVLNTITFG